MNFEKPVVKKPEKESATTFDAKKGPPSSKFTTTTTMGSTTPGSDSASWCAEDVGKGKCVIDDATVHTGACQNGLDSKGIQCLPPKIFDSYRCPSGLSKCKFGKPSTSASTDTTSSAAVTTTGAITEHDALIDLVTRYGTIAQNKAIMNI